MVDVRGAGRSFCKNFPHFQSREDCSNLSQEADDHKDGIHDKEAAVFQTGNGNSEESNDEDVEAQDDDVGRGHEEDGWPEAEFFDLKSIWMNKSLVDCSKKLDKYYGKIVSTRSICLHQYLKKGLSYLL